jgi:prepilin-type N-terminal cleavage/methylation domain-containing protein
MLRKARQLLLPHLVKSKGFTLIEAMISSAIVAMGFVGVFTLVAASEQFTQRAIARQKVQLIADQMLEIIETDLDNIDSYSMDLSTCTAPVTSEQWDIRGFEWCTRLQNEIGAAGAANTRTITITNLTGDRRLVSIFLEGYNQTVLVVMKRIFDV